MSRLRRRKRLYGPAQLGDAPAVLYTVPTGQRASLRNVYLNNPSGSLRKVTMSIGDDAADTRILDDLDVPAGESIQQRTRHTLEAGETIQGYADSADAVVAAVDGYSFEVSPVGELTLDRIEWEGFPYFTTDNGDQFAKAEAAGWAEDTFFPIGVWLSDPSHADELLALGINHMIGCNHTPPLTAVTNTGMAVVPQSNEWTTGEVGSNPLAVGWMVHDEPDLNVSLATYETDVDTVRGLDDGRFVQTNYAHGILRTHWWNADQGGGLTQMEIAFTQADVTGVDQYAYTSPGIVNNMNNPGGDCTSVAENWPGPSCDDAYGERCATYGWCIDMLRSFDGPTRRPQYITVETKMPYLNDAGRNIILYEEIEAAIFSALAHECRGIMYFQHNGFYDGSGITIDPNTGLAPDEDAYSLVDCEQGLRDYITDLNGRILALAPVLNTQSYVFDFGAANIDTMLKAKDGYAYIFASMGFEAATGSKTFTLTGSGIGGTTVDVVDEARQLNVSGGQFSDTFADEFSHHVYKVAI